MEEASGTDGVLSGGRHRRVDLVVEGFVLLFLWTILYCSYVLTFNVRITSCSVSASPPAPSDEVLPTPRLSDELPQPVSSTAHEAQRPPSNSRSS